VIDYGFGVRLGTISEINPDTMRAWRNEPAIYKWCRQYEPLEANHHYKWLDSLSSKTDIKMYSIRSPEESIGVCGLTSLDLINRRAEFSLYIAPEYHRKGHGEAALKTLCAHGFLVLGLHHIFGETFDGNPAAKSFERVGFVKEGTRRGFYFREGKFIDAHLYSILSEEFRAKWTL
jgi:RimJ/RimL family protein N-acetyltransferase